MRKRVGRILVFQAMLALVLTAAACNKSKKNTSDAVGQGPNAGGPPGMQGGQWPGGPGGKRGPIHEIMVKLMKGQQSLNGRIGQELDQSPPPWNQIQPQAKEYAQLASSISQYDPPKGDKDSWKKQTDSFAHSATELEHAAQAKNVDAAKAAYMTLKDSCQACHQAHKGGMGMRPGGFRGPGGPPQQ